MLLSLPQFLYDVPGGALQAGLGDFQWSLQPWSCCGESACRGNGGWGCWILLGCFSDTLLSLHSVLPAALSWYWLVKAMKLHTQMYLWSIQTIYFLYMLGFFFVGMHLRTITALVLCFQNFPEYKTFSVVETRGHCLLLACFYRHFFHLICFGPVIIKLKLLTKICLIFSLSYLMVSRLWIFRSLKIKFF